EPRRLGGLDVEVTGGDGPPGDRVAVAPQGEGRPAEEECRARSSGDEAGRLLVHDRFSLCWVLSARTTRGRGGSCSPSAVLGCSWAGQGPVGVTGPEAVHTISSPGSGREVGQWAVPTRSSRTTTSCRTVRPVLRTV